MKRVTLQELIEMLASLPEEIRAKQIGYLDLAHMTQEDLSDLKERLLTSKEDWIEQCAN